MSDACLTISFEEADTCLLQQTLRETCSDSWLFLRQCLATKPRLDSKLRASPSQTLGSLVWPRYQGDMLQFYKKAEENTPLGPVFYLLAFWGKSWQAQLTVSWEPVTPGSPESDAETRATWQRWGSRSHPSHLSTSQLPVSPLCAQSLESSTALPRVHTAATQGPALANSADAPSTTCHRALLPVLRRHWASLQRTHSKDAFIRQPAQSSATAYLLLVELSYTDNMLGWGTNLSMRTEISGSSVYSTCFFKVGYIFHDLGDI